MFAHSKKDGFLVALSLLQLSLLFALTVAHPLLSWPLVLLSGAALVFLNCTNYQCVAHNFLHNPFFRKGWVNDAFSILNSPVLGMPQTLYKLHHLNHHRHNNDRPDRSTGTTKDFSSTYRFGRKPGHEESIFAYSVFGPFRMPLRILYRKAQKKNCQRQVIAEIAGIVTTITCLCILDLEFFFLFLVPVWFLGQAAALAENYLEHHLAVPGDPRRDSISCYGRLYNLIWFNNGYHQEHHCHPSEHWTKIKSRRSDMLPETERRVVSGAHWRNFRLFDRTREGPQRFPTDRLTATVRRSVAPESKDVADRQTQKSN